MAEFRTYRHDITGVVSVEPVAAANRQPHLHEVDEDAKPLAYMSITDEEVAALGVADEDSDEFIDAADKLATSSPAKPSAPATDKKAK